MTPDETETMLRWRLILGAGTDESLQTSLPSELAQQDDLLAFLYDRELGEGRDTMSGEGGRRGGSGGSVYSVPDWINGIHTLFPKEVIHQLEQDAIERYEMAEMVTSPEVLKRITPSVTAVKAILQTRHLMNQEVLALARDMVKKVIDDLVKTLGRPVASPFQGARLMHRPTRIRRARNFDPLLTVKRNLQFRDPDSGRLLIRRPIFIQRQQDKLQDWQVIILVDQSGSMMDSVIHSAVTASIFHQLPGIVSHLIAFDTQVVDLTGQVADPVETLMQVQLGGGTDIGRALQYAAEQITNPKQAIVVLITDFYEGGSPGHMAREVKAMAEAGVKLLGLAALDSQATPFFDEQTVAQMSKLGMRCGAMTPGELAAWVAKVMKS